MSNLDNNAEQMLDAVIGGPEDIEAVARALGLVAAKRGYVVTIETAPLAPLAMGRYGLDVHVRPLRSTQHVREKNLAEYDCAVGRRRKWSSIGGAR